MQTALKGTGAAIITPFDTEGRVDEQGLANLVNYLAEGGLDLLVVMGTTGESVTLTKAEKTLVQETVLHANRARCRVMLGIGGNNTAEVVEAIKHTDFVGIDAILSVSPYYNKPSQEGIYQHYKTIAEASPRPVMLYNVPGRTGSNITAETTLRLAHDCRNICGIKEASGNLEQISEILRDRPEGFIVSSGDDSLTLPILACGGDGVISVSANAFPAHVSAMVRAALEGNFGEAKKWHLQLLGFHKVLFADGNPGGIKAALKILGICEETVRLPLVNVKPEVYQLIEREVMHLKKHHPKATFHI